MEKNLDKNTYDHNFLSDYLFIYYQRLFPFNLYYQWLKYNDEKLFSTREFSFTLKDDIYLRYQSFKDEAEMKKEILQKCPYKIDIGAVYSFRPREQRTVSNFYPVEKELVFDIDMTDYDEVRTCCNGADICNKCWPFMIIAIKILDRALKEDFGFEHLLWVYSGRRGVHCWVCDEAARKLTSQARIAIVDYLTVIKGGEFQTKKVFLPEILHPCLKKAADIITDYFDDLILDKQRFLDSEENCEKIVSLCLDNNAKQNIKNSLLKFQSTKEKWHEIQNIEEVIINKGRYKNFLYEVIFQLCYPRLDVNVTKGLNHLLKAPFCIHPKTGRVCVPIDVKNIDSFDPFSVPTINSLCKEIDEYDLKIQDKLMESKKIEDYNKTSLCKSIEIFKNFINKMN